MTACRADADTVVRRNQPFGRCRYFVQKCHSTTGRFQPAFFREQRDIYRQGDPSCKTDTRPSKDSLFYKWRELRPQQGEDRRISDKYAQQSVLQNQFLHLYLL